MDQRTYITISGTIFTFITLLHLARIVFGWEATIVDWMIPQWLSGLAVGIAGVMAITAWKVRR